MHGLQTFVRKSMCQCWATGKEENPRMGLCSEEGRNDRPPCLEPQELPSPGFEVAPVSEELRPLNRERPRLVGRSFHCSNQISFPPSGVSLAPSGVSTSPLAITSVPIEVSHAPGEGFFVRIVTSQISKTKADSLQEAFWGSAESLRASNGKPKQM